MSLNKKVYAATGGASAIGLATAELLLSRGASVSLCDIQAASLERVATITIKTPISDSTKTQDAPLYSQKVDVRSRKQVEDWMSKTIERFGRLDGAANLACAIPKSQNIAYVADQDDGE
ncbi:hypothetical protein NCS57_01337900 [Fusarium keratoplasticum]|uniref:Uncharacterized protein n=1 Tax=Fusarium keratoplasticum TaxID=1328300 RepID=A0ACC0QID5_9HYPO|nr:hypothetical protein NCS57_01337900 [Fusarium keratoplasticum]KAI8652729.1 hypothetical protein NCS57_01337900 [Fusarium keratoplasticum]KAI8653442.1 hypothetical protein NCS55_01330500 [Fusarium keratoplasticum]